MPVSTPMLIGLAIAATAVSVGFSVIQSRQQGKSASAIAKANARISRQRAAEEARQAEIVGAAQQRQLIDKRRRILARNRARTGKAGVTAEGSPLIVAQEVDKVIRQDIRTTDFNIQSGVTAAITRGESEAQLSLFQGKAALSASRLQIGQALFSGGAKIATLALLAQKKKKPPGTGGKAPPGTFGTDAFP